MTDIVLDDIASGYNLNKINTNFTKIEEVVNTEVLHTAGGNNTMQQVLDMNGYAIINANIDSSEVVGGISEEEADLRYVNVTGDVMTGALEVRTPILDTEPVRLDMFNAALAALPPIPDPLTLTAGRGIDIDYGDPTDLVVSTALPSPIGHFYGRSGIVAIEGETDEIAGDPQIIWDASVNKWRMYFFRTYPSGTRLRESSATADSLEGPWVDHGVMSGLDSYHKFALLVDSERQPVLIGGSYYGYATYYNTSASPEKEVYVFSGPTLTGPWTNGGKVIPKGGVGSIDGFFTDTPYALYEDDTIYLYYMAAPATSLPTYGLAMRAALTTSNNPLGPFTKQGEVILPTTTPGGWDFGWIGGMQVFKVDDQWVTVYNAGDNRPISAGEEPATSQIGFATSESPVGPFVRNAHNPYTSLNNIPANIAENTNIWRGHAVYDYNIDAWYLYYNTGSWGDESITFARQDILSFRYVDPDPLIALSGGNLVFLTASEQIVPSSRSEVPPGQYRVRVQANIISGSLPGVLKPIDVDTRIRVGGVTHTFVREFVGSYAYENRDSIVEAIIFVKQRTYIDVSAQVMTAGDPGNPRLRNFRMIVQKIK